VSPFRRNAIAVSIAVLVIALWLLAPAELLIDAQPASFGLTMPQLVACGLLAVLLETWGIVGILALARHLSRQLRPAPARNLVAAE